MDFVLASSFPKPSTITAGANSWRSKQYARNYNTSSYVMHKTGKSQKEFGATMLLHSSKYHYKVIGEGSKCQDSERKYVVNATTSGQSFGFEHQAQGKKNITDFVKDGLVVLYQFTRPYSTLSLALETTSMSLLAVEKLSDLSPVFVIGVLQGIAASIFMTTIDCGMNQLCDLEIDKINKPYLPLASGKLSFKTGVIIVASFYILVFLYLWIIGSWPLFWHIFINSVLGAAYSLDLPLLRWKKSSILTTINIASRIGIVHPITSYLHMQTHVFKRPATFPRQLILSITIMSIIGVVITLFKDVPDMEGDEKFGIQSLSLRLGQKRVFWICISLLYMAFGVAVLAGATSRYLWSKISMGMGHAILALVLTYHAKSVDLKNVASSQSFYMFIWKLLSAECFLLPLFR